LRFVKPSLPESNPSFSFVEPVKHEFIPLSMELYAVNNLEALSS